MDLDSERVAWTECECCGRLPLRPPPWSVSNPQWNSILKDCILPGLNMPAKDEHPAFLALALRRPFSRAPCLCFGGNNPGKKTHVCKLLSINDTQTFQPRLAGLCVSVCGSHGVCTECSSSSRCTRLYHQRDETSGKAGNAWVSENTLCCVPHPSPVRWGLA